MSMMYSNPPVMICADDHGLDASTAPTTPDDSLTFSPVLLPAKLQDALEDAKIRSYEVRPSRSPITATLFSNIGIKNICCIGAGYVGGPTAAIIAFQNPYLNVTVVDRDATRIQQWRSRHLPIYEPGLSEIVRITRDGAKECSFTNEPARPNLQGCISRRTSATSECESQCGVHRDQLRIPPRAPNLFFSTAVPNAIGEADIILIAVNTPTKVRGLGAGKATDMTALEAVTKEIALHARPGAILVEKSTVPCKTVELIQNILKTYRPDTTFEILSNPEFLAAGTAINDLRHPDRVIIGSASTPSGHRAAQLLASIYTPWVPRSKIVTMNIYSSELSKLVANSMLAQRISSINSISAICEATGADVDEVARSIGMDVRIGSKYLKAGLGFGGSCFKKDILSLCYLAGSLGLEEVSDYWEQVLKMNEFQRTRFVKGVVKCLNGTLVGKKLTVLGYAFKQDTSDTRESPALECIKELLEDGPVEIAVFDPCCNPAVIRDEIERLLGNEVLKSNGGSIMVYSDAYAACADSHAVLIMTECDYFRSSGQTTPGYTPLPTSASSRGPLKLSDPWSFQNLEPTEFEFIALTKYLSSTTGSSDRLQRFEEEPSCEDECVKCAENRVNGDDLRSVRRLGQDNRNERLDWPRIAYHLQTPKWVFDGRGVLEVSEIEALGVRLVAVGRAGRRR